MLYLYQIFIFLLGHLHFFLHFFFSFMENLFKKHPILSVGSKAYGFTNKCIFGQSLGWESELEYQDCHRSEFAFYHLVMKKHHETSWNSISPFLERDLYSNMLIRLKCMIFKDYFLFFMFDSMLFWFFSIFSCSDSFNTLIHT